MPRSDVVVIGAGHNGLVAAAYLAKAGRTVTLLEAAPEVGGVLRNSDDRAEGFTAPGITHTVGRLRPSVVEGPEAGAARLPAASRPTCGCSRRSPTARP